MGKGASGLLIGPLLTVLTLPTQLYLPIPGSQFTQIGQGAGQEGSEDSEMTTVRVSKLSVSKWVSKLLGVTRFEIEKCFETPFTPYRVMRERLHRLYG
jgi:hypothetical protein